MAGARADTDGCQYACKCLNIRIKLATTQSVPTDFVQDPNFTPVFVGEEGIVVEHTQVTVRTRTQGTPINGTSRYYRYTTITCLLCDLLVYRVYQTYPADVDGKDGPLLPTEDWVEHDIMKSLTGWIEVHKECLVARAVERAMLSENYSTTFSVLLPQTLSPSTSVEPIFERPASRLSISPSPPPPKYFSNLRPVFLPPPFTPSHPVFAHLASISANQSQSIRDAAEDYMRDQFNTKTSEIEKADADLRRNVESLWKKFREGVSLIQQERDHADSLRTSKSRQQLTTNGFQLSTSGTATREFIPAVVSPAAFSPASLPRVSALSASLATSSFHLRTRTTHTSPSPSGQPASEASSGSVESLRSKSSTLILPQSPKGSNVLKYRRNLQESVDYATSYRYFVDREKDIIELRGRQAENYRTHEESDETQRDGPLDAVTGMKEDSEAQEKPELESHLDHGGSHQHFEDHEGHISTTSRHEKSSKGKRTVTFDVQPAIVTIEREVNAEIEDGSDNQDPREMIFEFDDASEEGIQQVLSFSRPTPLATEQPPSPVHPRRHRLTGSISVSSPFSGLRPASLPTPSAIRPPRGQHGSDFSVPSMMLSLPKPSLSVRKDKGKQTSRSEAGPSAARSPEDKGYPQDAEILKLVAANTPSHRGAWRPDSKAWQTFVRRQTRSHGVNKEIPEEREDDGDDGLNPTQIEVNRPIASNDEEGELNDGRRIVVGSLPIPIQLHRRPPALSLSSYQHKTLGTQGEAGPEPQAPSVSRKRPSPTAIRKAVYAERDLLRSMDPGTLDFSTEDEDENGEGDDEADAQSDKPEVGDRGRKRALKILQSQSEIPEAGMWRSMAS